MTARCIKCSNYLDFGRSGDRLKDMRCNCGGTYERLTYVPKAYSNSKGDIFMLKEGKFIQIG